jgi:hypothetical protein
MEEAVRATTRYDGGVLSSLERSIRMFGLAAAVACGSGVPAGAGDAGAVAGPILHLDRNPVLLGAAVGTRATGNLQISNVGTGELQITSLSLAFADGSLPRAIDAGGVFDQPIIRVDAGAFSDVLPVQISGSAGFVEFDFAPVDGSATRVQLLIDSNAAAQPHLAVPVTGCGLLPDGGGDIGACTCPDGGC